jgi:TonB family protein
VSAQEPDEFYRAGPGVTLPQVTHNVSPTYTSDAMREQVTGRVGVECIVELDGVPSHIRVVQPLHPSLDAEAIKAMEQWRFTPGTKDGKPARILITVEMTFSMAPASGPPQNVTILRRTNADGVSVSWEVTRDRFDRQPTWSPDSGTPPPLSLSDALHTANEWLQKNGERTNTGLMQSASLLRFGGRYWYYRVEYATVPVTAANAADRITVVVLIDGSVVEPK